MKNTSRRILVILTAIMLCLPLVQQHLKPFGFRPLSGVVKKPEKPELGWNSWCDHSVQTWAESYLKLHYGLREPLTRLYNQYLWDFYDMANLRNKKWIYISDDGWFYESPNMEEFYRGEARYYSTDSLDMANKLDAEALRIYHLQQLLEAHDVHLFVLLEPGKEQVYPEHVPVTSNYPGEKKISATAYYSKKFKELGVNHIDVGQWFLDIKDTVDYPLFPQSGVHWSNLAAMHVADSLIRYMEQLGNKRLNHFTIGEKYLKTVKPDDDLEQVLNLARPLKKTLPNYYADCTLEVDSTVDRPVLITIGDSFYWNIINCSPIGGIMGGIPYWYYYHTVYFDGEKHDLDPTKVKDKVLAADFVMLAFSTPQIYEMSKGFTQQLLDEFGYEDLHEPKPDNDGI